MHVVKVIQGIFRSIFYPYSSEIDFSIIEHGQVYYHAIQSLSQTFTGIVQIRHTSGEVRV